MKIHIIGCSGTGKTYMAERLSEKYKIPHFDLDDIQWDNNSHAYGVKMPIERRDSLLQDMLKKDSWIIEGVYYAWVQECFENADIIYVLDMPKHIYKTRIIIRFIKRKFQSKKAKKETLRSLCDLLKWTDDFQKRNMNEIKQILNKYEDKVVRLKKVQEVNRIITD